MTKFQEKVARGIKWLDKEYPNGWRHKIDLEQLNMGHENKCILGQITGDYNAAVKNLKMDYVEAESLGFIVGDSDSKVINVICLQKAWEDVLATSEPEEVFTLKSIRITVGNLLAADCYSEACRYVQKAFDSIGKKYREEDVAKFVQVIST